MASHNLGLVGDIGATNARFALVQPTGAMTPPRLSAVEDHASLAEAVEDYLRETGAKPREAALAIAAPVAGDQVTLTNHPWSFSSERLRTRLKLARLLVVNDFAANALAIPHLHEGELAPIGGGAGLAGAAIGVIGPGSGLGVSGLIPGRHGAIAIDGEGGHATMAPADARESAVLDLLRKRFDHVSAERVLSGPGLVNLYNALCELAGVPAASLAPQQIASPAIWDEDPHARDAVAMFCAMLGTVAGNLALTLGARGGVYVAGGIVPKLGSAFVQSQFRARFEDKGRFRDYLAKIPTYVILRPTPALLGAAALLAQSAVES
jgi:glucokinase